MLAIYHVPLPLLLLMILLPCLLLGLAGTWLVRRKNWMVDPDDNDAIAVTHAFAGVLYAVALGLMVVNVQSGYTEVKMVVMNEANLVEDLFIDVGGLSGPITGDIRRLTRDYASAVIDEWRDIDDREDSELPSHAAIEQLTVAILRHEPVSDKDRIVYAEIFSSLNDMLDMRRERLLLGRDGISPVVWLVVAMGALITIGMTCFYQTRQPRTHYGLVGMMSVLFGMMIFLIAAMDHPLLGEFSVDSEPFASALADMAIWEAHLGGSD